MYSTDIRRRFSLIDEGDIASSKPANNEGTCSKIASQVLLRSVDAPDDTLLSRYLPYLRTSASHSQYTSNSVLFSVCRPNLGLNPILWLPMTYAERSRVIRWRLGWLPGSIPQPCIYHPNVMLTRSHATECLHMHRRLQMPRTEADPLSFLLNQLPNKRKKLMSPNANSTNSAWTVRWPAICQILFELDYMHHGKLPPESPPLGTKLVAWICNN
ncbi:hypothetical protein G6F37_011056 [Rhizopus arrhizus]|nr:hypothetical protein G6F38_011244 [Rhizopus arrhizus]KAG1151118.1 hypothetical protein G6F37_011056 [Rhizopus arrhizus]